jgi:hypothetical protein
LLRSRISLPQVPSYHSEWLELSSNNAVDSIERLMGEVAKLLRAYVPG